MSTVINESSKTALECVLHCDCNAKKTKRSCRQVFLTFVASKILCIKTFFHCKLCINTQFILIFYLLQQLEVTIVIIYWMRSGTRAYL